MGNCWHKMPRAVIGWSKQSAPIHYFDQLFQRIGERLNPDSAAGNAVWYDATDPDFDGSYRVELYLWAPINDGSFNSLYSLIRYRHIAAGAATADDVVNPFDAFTYAGVWSQWTGGAWVEQGRFESNPAHPTFEDFAPHAGYFFTPGGRGWFPLGDRVPFGLTISQAVDPATRLALRLLAVNAAGVEYVADLVLRPSARVIENYDGEQTAGFSSYHFSGGPFFGVGPVERFEFAAEGGLPCLVATFPQCRDPDIYPSDVRLFTDASYDVDQDGRLYNFLRASFYSPQTGEWTPVSRPAVPRFSLLPVPFTGWQNSVASMRGGIYGLNAPPLPLGDLVVTVLSLAVI